MPNARLIQGLTPEARDLAKRAKTPGPGVMANRKIINKNDTAFSGDMENIPSKIYYDYFLYAKLSCDFVQIVKYQEPLDYSTIIFICPQKWITARKVA
jgi:hypothetical protein